ncbi:MAG: hypothetical protein J6N95_00600 [Bacilli bacterium]|nr:hypothetical protein [Bacilli bacterium]
MKEFKLNQTYFKALVTIKALNDLHYYPLNEGIYKILVGIVDEDTKQFVDLDSFGTLISFTSKKVCRLTMMLYRYGYIGRVFDTKTKELYFSLTDKGYKVTEQFLKKHKKPFARRSKNSSPTIVKID